MSPIMQQFHEIETYIECSASRHIQVLEVFFFAHKAALYPTMLLYDHESQTLTPRCKRALKRIFVLSDRDRDGALSDDELDDFQVVQKNLSDGVNEKGLTLKGFLFLHTLFIEKGPIETTWAVLRKFGYNDDLKLANDPIPHLKRAHDQSVELTNEAIDFLKTIFNEFDGDHDGMLQPCELEELFSTAPESPWIENPYKDAVERNAFGGLSLDAFLSE
ncbi:mitochondrial rho GTPase 1-like protein, partial [Trifolium pratense]